MYIYNHGKILISSLFKDDEQSLHLYTFQKLLRGQSNSTTIEMFTNSSKLKRMMALRK